MPTVAALERRLDALEPAARAALIERADQIAAHRFDLLGSGPRDLGRPIDWSVDFKSGRRWPIRHISSLPVTYPDGSDVKVPWELSRAQHLPLLAAASRLTVDDRYAVELRAQMADWIAANPVERGPNWLCTMDVAIRAANWVAALALCPEAAGDEVLGSLLLHGRFIRSHLEWTPVRGNHYLADLAGLLVVSTVFGASAEGVEWAELATRELVAEMSHQVLDDGCSHEASLPYHRLVAELFLCSGQAADAALPGRLPQSYRDRLDAMLAVVAAVRRPDGLSPQIGDADDGRFLPLDDYGDRDARDHTHLFAQAGRSVPTAPVASDLPTGGYWVRRRGDLWLLVRCGSTGMRGRGGHGHNDALSFELAVGGHPVVVDPGSYLYTADSAARDAFRATRAHSTLQVDGAEQNDLGENLFLLPDRATARMVRATPVLLEGVHHGFAEEHRRRFELHEDELVITDWIGGKATHDLDVAFPLDPGCSARVDARRVTIRVAGWVVMLLAPDFELELDAGWHSPSYGVKVRTSVVRGHRRGTGVSEMRLRAVRDGSRP